MADFRVTLNRDWPVVGGDWDSGAARARIFQKFTNADGEFDASGAADYFLLADPSTGLKGDLHLPVADIRDGKSVIVASALRSKLSRIGQGFPKDVPAADRERAAEVARAKLAEFNESRADFADDSIYVMLVLPDDIAAQFPPLGEHEPPHITLAHIEHGTMDDAMAVCEIALGCCHDVVGERVEMRGLDYFEGDDQSVAYAPTDVSEDMRAARDRMVDQIRAGGLEVSRAGQSWVPHATIAYLDSGEKYSGALPGGDFTVVREDMCVKHGGVRVDMLRRKGRKFQVWSEDGSKRLGEYDTKAEALERLRQIEAAKYARKDARSDEEMAEIRSRWARGEGPNMGAARHREWLDSPFSGPNRKTGPARERARRVANRAQRVMAKSTEEWTPQDYSDALTIMAFIARHSEQDEGDPIVIDGREGPSPNRAALMDWGFDPKLARRQDAQLDLPLRPEPVVRFDADGSLTIKLGSQAMEMVANARSLAPAVITEPKTAIWVPRADRMPIGTRLEPAQVADRMDAKAVEDINGWVLYPVIYSRGDNIQVYRGIREFRPWEIVRSTIAHAPGSPWELRHSADLLNPDTVAGAALGAVVTAEAMDETRDVRGLARAWGAELIDAIEAPRADGGARDISVAYRVKVDRRPGRTDTGEPFDQRVIDLRWNSIASEPRGRAGTARVLARKDAMPVGRPELLAIARGARRLPSKPIFYSRADAAQHQDQDQDQTMKTMMMMLQALIDAAGMTLAGVAERMGVDEETMRALMEGATEMDADQMAKLAAILTGAAEMEAEEGREDQMKSMKEQLAEARADRDRFRQDAADSRQDADALSSGVEAIGAAWEITRQDGESPADYAARVAKTGLDLMRDGAEAMALTWRGRGRDYQPETRQDADGNDVPMTVRAWKREAVAASFGLMALDDAERESAERERQDALREIDEAPDSAVDYVLDRSLDRARKRFDAAENKIESVKSAVQRSANNNANHDRRQDGETTNRLRRARERATAAARGEGQGSET